MIPGVYAGLGGVPVLTNQTENLKIPREFRRVLLQQ
jgi:hypothetical protein